ncbi:MAG: SCO family protein [Burkholderiaceae bacterium]
MGSITDSSGGAGAGRRRRWTNVLGRLSLTLALALTLGGCDRGREPPADDKAVQDLTGAAFGRHFELSDHAGQRRRLADYAGKVVVLFFGYTQCPDVCPTTLSTMREAIELLGPDAGKVQVLFATIDPERDSAEMLAQYVGAFHPSFVGLRGNDAQTASMVREFKLTVVRFPTANGQYTVDHSVGSYVFDRGGHLRLYLPHGHPPRAVADALRRLLIEPA